MILKNRKLFYSFLFFIYKSSKKVYCEISMNYRFKTYLSYIWHIRWLYYKYRIVNGKGELVMDDKNIYDVVYSSGDDNNTYNYQEPPVKVKKKRG